MTLLIVGRVVIIELMIGERSDCRLRLSDYRQDDRADNQSDLIVGPRQGNGGAIAMQAEQMVTNVGGLWGEGRRTNCRFIRPMIAPTFLSCHRAVV
jgi:hypothetical protein